MESKVDSGDKKIKEESFKLNKAVNDLEAHINTSIITVSDKQLMLSIGKICQEGLRLAVG